MAFVSGNKHIILNNEIYSQLKICHATNFQNYKLVSFRSIGPSRRGTLQAGGHIFSGLPISSKQFFFRSPD